MTGLVTECLRKRESRLRARIRANCCEFHGLTDAQMEAHVRGIEQVVLKARRRNGV